MAMLEYRKLSPQCSQILGRLVTRRSNGLTNLFVSRAQPGVCEQMSAARRQKDCF